MGNIIYDHADNINVLMLAIYGCLIIAGIGTVIYALFIMANKECEFDGRPMKLKNVPLGFRLVMQGFPALLGVLLIVSGAMNLYSMGKCSIYYGKGEVQEITGKLSDVSILWDENDNEADPEISFTVEGQQFQCTVQNEKAEDFENGLDVTVEYGYAGDELLLYYVYTQE